MRILNAAYFIIEDGKGIYRSRKLQININRIPKIFLHPNIKLLRKNY